jgi:hypothetical protein
MAILKESDSLPTETRMSAEQKREILLEAARGATWDTTRGPMHLRTGRFFVSQVHGVGQRRRTRAYTFQAHQVTAAELMFEPDRQAY